MNTVHGGDVWGFMAQYQKPPIDFSVNLNPLGMPDGVRSVLGATADWAQAYPDPFSRELTMALAKQLALPKEYLIFGNGAADLIYRLAFALRPQKALLPSPAFSEYESALCAAGCEVIHAPLRRESGFVLDAQWLKNIVPGIEMVFLCNPANPTGVITKKGMLLEALRLCEQAGALLIVDECFICFADDGENLTLCGEINAHPSLFVLDAFTKRYAMAGLRLGYGLCSDVALLQKLRQAAQPWSVSGPAQAAGLAALAEGAYLSHSRTFLKKEREWLMNELKQCSMETADSRANFIFFHAQDPLLHQKLGQKRILIRDCANYRGLIPGDYRVAVRQRPDNELLIKAIREIAYE